MTSLEDQVILDKWEQMLQSIEPEYSKLKDMLEQGPTYKAVKVRKHTVSIEETWPEGYEGSYLLGKDDLMLDDIVDEVANELFTWPDVTRTAWNQWKFKNSKEADKFITWYNLKWRK